MRSRREALEECKQHTGLYIEDKAFTFLYRTIAELCLGDDESLGLAFAALAHVRGKADMAAVIDGKHKEKLLPEIEPTATSSQAEVIDLTQDEDQSTDQQDIKLEEATRIKVEATIEFEYDALLARKCVDGVWYVLVKWSDSWISGKQRKGTEFLRMRRSVKVNGVWQHLIEWKPTWEPASYFTQEMILEYLS